MKMRIIRVRTSPAIHPEYLSIETQAVSLLSENVRASITKAGREEPQDSTEYWFC